MNVMLTSEEPTEQAASEGDAIEETTEAPVEAAAEVIADVPPQVVAEAVADVVTEIEPVQETAVEPVHTIAHAPHLEQHADNEPMRHIPALTWMSEKLDGDVRRRIDKMTAALDTHPAPEIEHEIRCLSRALDRLADASKHIRNNGHGPNEPLPKLRWSLNHALSCLRLTEAATFGRRAPFHTFERSKSETIYGAFLTVLHHLQRLLEVVRPIDPRIDERLNEGLVQLIEPLREQPIA